MRRLQDLILFAGLAVLATSVAAAFVWLSFVLALGAGQAIAGTLGEALAAVLGTVLLVIGCLLAAQVAVWARGRWEIREGSRRVAQRQRDLESLRRDPARAHWSPLAERMQVADAGTVARWEARYRELLADPRRRAFAVRALDGEFLTDAQIELLLDVDRRIVCAHLQPLEQALRAAGAPMVMQSPGVIRTEWSLDGPRLIAGLALPGVVWEVPPAHPRDPEPGQVVCTACGSRIEGGFGASFPPSR